MRNSYKEELNENTILMLEKSKNKDQSLHLGPFIHKTIFE